jgi:hypothetical protein
MNEFNPKNDIFMKVANDVSWVSECSGSNLYLEFIDTGNVQGLATGSMAGLGGLVYSGRSLMHQISAPVIQQKWLFG